MLEEKQRGVKEEEEEEEEEEGVWKIRLMDWM